MTTTPRRTVRALLAATAVLALAGCSEVEDAAKDAAGDAGCSAARSAVDGAQTQAESAIDKIGADPTAAKNDLENLRDVVQTAEDRLSGDTKARVADVRQALDDLATEAGDAADGAVDTKAVEQSKQDLADAVTSVKDVC